MLPRENKTITIIYVRSVIIVGRLAKNNAKCQSALPEKFRAISQATTLR